MHLTEAYTCPSLWKYTKYKQTRKTTLPTVDFNTFYRSKSFCFHSPLLLLIIMWIASIKDFSLWAMLQTKSFYRCTGRYTNRQMDKYYPTSPLAGGETLHFQSLYEVSTQSLFKLQSYSLRQRNLTKGSYSNTKQNRLTGIAHFTSPDCPLSLNEVSTKCL